MPFGASSWNSTVEASTAFAPPFDSTPVNADSAFEPLSGSARRSKVLATSSASITLPSWNFTPLRSLKVHTLPSAFGFQLSASRGSGLSLRSDQIRYSPVWLSMVRPAWLLTVTGSTAPGGSC